MKMKPPALTNRRVIEHMANWALQQPYTVKMTSANEFVVTPVKTTDYPIDLNTKLIMLREFVAILEYNGFKAYQKTAGDLLISKEGWTLNIKNIHEQLPFSECLLAQIESSYNHHVQEAEFNEMIRSGSTTIKINYGMPRPNQYIDMREALKDFINDTNKD